MEPLTNAQRRAVLSEFFDRTEDGKALLPAPKPLPYDPVPGIATAGWSIFSERRRSGDEHCSGRAER